MTTNYELVKNYFRMNHVKGTLECSVNHIAKELNISNQNVLKYIKKMEGNKEIKTLVKPSRGRYAKAKWKVNIEKETTLNENYGVCETINFEGVELVVYQTEIGGCLLVEDLAIATLTDYKTIDKIIESNKELFVNNIAIKDEKKLINKFGIMHYLLKLNLDRSLDIKRKVLAEFQTNIVEKMCDAMLIGKIVLTQDDQLRLVTNIHQLADITKSEVEEIFNNIDGQLKEIAKTFYSKNVESQNTISRLEKSNKRLHGQLETEKQAKELLITENRELSNKLLDRQN